MVFSRSGWENFRRSCQTKANQSPFGRGCRDLGYTELPPLLKSCGTVEFEIAPS